MNQFSLLAVDRTPNHTLGVLFHAVAAYELPSSGCSFLAIFYRLSGLKDAHHLCLVQNTIENYPFSLMSIIGTGFALTAAERQRYRDVTSALIQNGPCGQLVSHYSNRRLDHFRSSRLARLYSAY